MISMLANRGYCRQLSVSILYVAQQRYLNRRRVRSATSATAGLLVIYRILLIAVSCADLLCVCVSAASCEWPVIILFILLKPCPHCRRKVRLSPFTCRFRRQSPFSATVAVFDSVDRALGYSSHIRSFTTKALSTLATIVAGNGDNLSPTDSRRFRWQSPKMATVAEFGDYSRVASVDRA